MLQNNKHFAQILLPFSLILYSVSALAADPFIKKWAYFDGVKNYILNITKSSAPGQSYHIDYTFPGGKIETDMCRATSDIAMSCATGDILVRNDLAYSITLKSRNNTYTFYDPKHMPQADYLLGGWNATVKSEWSNDITYYHIDITLANTSKQYNVASSFSDSRGNFCSNNPSLTYQLVQNSDGTQTLTYNNPTGNYSFMYNPSTHQITNPNPSRDFQVGNCVYISKYSNFIFTKS